MDCRDCQHLNLQFLWCKEHRKEIERPWEVACKDFVPLGIGSHDQAGRLEKALDVTITMELYHTVAYIH